jgi:hypothetical protein
LLCFSVVVVLEELLELLDTEESESDPSSRPLLLCTNTLNLVFLFLSSPSDERDDAVDDDEDELEGCRLEIILFGDQV